MRVPHLVALDVPRSRMFSSAAKQILRVALGDTLWRGSSGPDAAAAHKVSTVVQQQELRSRRGYMGCLIGLYVRGF